MKSTRNISPVLTLWNKQQHYSRSLQRKKARQKLLISVPLTNTLRSPHRAFLPAGASYHWKGADNFLCFSKQSKLPELSLAASL